MRDLDHAESAYTRAIELAPSDGEAHRGRRDVRVDAMSYRSALEDATRVVELAPGSSDDWWKRGSILESLGEPERALADHERSLELSPGNLGATLLRASCLTRLGRHEAAIEALDLLVARTSAPYPKVALAEALMARGTEADLAEARALLDQVVDDAKYAGSALAARSKLHERLGDLEAALRDARTWTERAPSYSMAWAGLANALERLDRFEDALGAVDRALALAPTSGGLIATRASLLAKLKRFEEALAACDLAVRRTPELDLVYATRASVRARLCDLEGSLADAELVRARTDDPTLRVELAFGSGHALLALGRPDEALACAREMLALRPGEPRALGILGMARLRSGDTSGALEALDAAVEASPGSAAARAQRAAARFEVGDLAGCESDADEALRLEPSNRIARIVRAGVRRFVADLAGSLADAEVLLSEDPDDPTGLGVRATTLLWLDRPDEASRDARRALEVAPGAAVPRVVLAELHLRGGERAQAVEECTRALASLPTTYRALVTRARALLDEDPARARADLERLLQLAPRHPEATEARALLRTLVASESDDDRGDE